MVSCSFLPGFPLDDACVLTMRDTVARLNDKLRMEIFDGQQRRIPVCIYLRVVFDGEAYDTCMGKEGPDEEDRVAGGDGVVMDGGQMDVQGEQRRYDLKRGLAEAFELCKRGR